MQKSFTILSILLSSLIIAYAVPPQMSHPVKVTGTVVDFNRAADLLALKDAQGVDAKLKQSLMITERSKTQKWLQSLDKSFQVIEIKKDDMKAIRKRSKITITDYQYGVDSGFLIIEYSSLKLED